MQANLKTNATDIAQQADNQSDLDVIETDIENNQGMSMDDVRFVSELGWLSAAAVVIAGVAASI